MGTPDGRVLLLELFAELGRTVDGKVYRTDGYLANWPVAVLTACKSQGLLRQAGFADSTQCPGCGNACAMQVDQELMQGKQVWYVQCLTLPTMGRVDLEVAAVSRWRCGVKEVWRFVGEALELYPQQVPATFEKVWPLGLFHGKKRDQFIWLDCQNGLQLRAGNQVLPLADLLVYSEGLFGLDRLAVVRMVDRSSTGDARYTPNSDKREVSKHATANLHNSWRSVFQNLKKTNPNMSGVWYAQRIAKTVAVKGRAVETIRKEMVKPLRK